MSRPGGNGLQVVKWANGRFVLKNRLGCGSFGDIYLADDMQDHSKVAVKVEHTKARYPQLNYESRVYEHIHAACKVDVKNTDIQAGMDNPTQVVVQMNNPNANVGNNGSGGSTRPGYTSVTVGIPEIRWVGQEGDYVVMVMSLLGPTLEDLLTYCGRRFTIRTTGMIAVQIISRLEAVHKAHYIHRDIKPENFLMGVGSRAHHVYIVDFGLSKKYWDAKLGSHVPFKDGKPVTGTARYCSVNAHLGSEQGRRDDMEAVAYLLVYLHRGRLPWQGLKVADPSQKTARIGDKKIATAVEAVGKDIDPVFTKYLKYTRSMAFEETPNYNLIREWFTEVATMTPSLATLISGVSSVNQRHRGSDVQSSDNPASPPGTRYPLDWIYDWVAKRHEETKVQLTEGGQQMYSQDPGEMDSVATQPHDNARMSGPQPGDYSRSSAPIDPSRTFSHDTAKMSAPHSHSTSSGPLPPIDAARFSGPHPPTDGARFSGPRP